MNARIMFKALALAVALAAVGCTQRTIIEEPVSQDEASSPAGGAPAAENVIGNHPLYVRSGDTDPGETQAGPQPEPWQQRLGPQPEPWKREGDQDDGRSPPPPADPDPNPDPNPKP